VLALFPEANGSLPSALYRLLDPSAPIDLPAPGSVKLGPADNRELDKLVAALGRTKQTWRRALALHEWLLQSGHRADDRLCTTLIRVCAQHGQATTALALYDWMRAPRDRGGAALGASVFTYTAAMRAALAGGMVDRALQVWDDAVAERAEEIDCRLCTALIEAHARRGDAEAALEAYRRMRAAPAGSRLAPSVHAYTAAMRAAAEGGRWEDALVVWDEMMAAGCKPTGHAYAAAISACAAGGLWQRAVALFDDMLAWGVKPDVVSCTALVSALGADGQWERAEKVLEWMLRNDIKPNVRTYTALVSALGAARQWSRAVGVVRRMKKHGLGAAIEPNAYTYSALLKCMGEHGQWALAEELFAELEADQLEAMRREAAAEESNSAGQEIRAFPGMSLEGRSGKEEATAIGAALAARTALAAVPAETWEERMAAEDLAEQVLGCLDLGAAPGGAGRVVAVADGVDGLESPPPSVDRPAASSPARPAFNDADHATADGFSYFSDHHHHSHHAHHTDSIDTHHHPTPINAVSAAGTEAWTSENAALRGLHFHLESSSALSSATAASRPRHLARGKGPINEVVCGALMLAYERAGKWRQAVGVLDRARAMGERMYLVFPILRNGTTSIPKTTF
jgi:pentatricopeptide repeat protein